MPLLVLFLLLPVLCRGWGAVVAETHMWERYERYVREFGKVSLMCEDK